MKTPILPALLVGLVGISAARGELLIRESFDYASGNVGGTPENPVAANATGLTGDWSVGGHGAANDQPNINFTFNSIPFQNHFPLAGGAMDVRNLRGGNWNPLGASVPLDPALDLGSRPVLWTSALIRVENPPEDGGFYNDWRVEYRLNTNANAPLESSALRVMGRDFGSGTTPQSRAAVGADYTVNFQNPGTIQPFTNYLYITRSTVNTTTRSITEITLFVLDQEAYNAYRVAVIDDPANAEPLLNTHALFTLTDTNVDSGTNTLDDKTVLQFSITGGPVGIFDEVRLGTTLGDVVSQDPNLYFELTLDSASINFTSGTIVVGDRLTGVVDPTKLEDFYLEVNGLFLDDFDVEKVGEQTTITFDYPFEPNVFYSLYLLVPRTDGFIDAIAADLTSHRIPLDLAGPSGSVGSWAIREYFNPKPAPEPTEENPDPQPGPVAGNIAAAAQLVANAEEGEYVEDTDVPVLNHSDPNTQNPGTRGNFNNDLPILSDTPGDDNWVVVAKTQLSIPAAGVYTFSVHSDDGFALRIGGGAGGRFIAAHGSGGIDPADDQTIFLDGGTGDSNTRGVYQFDGAGTYDVTYLGWDGGGGGYHELAWAEGNFTADRDTNTWTLVGNPSHPDVVSIPFERRFLTEVPAPPAQAGNFSIRTYMGAAGTGSLQAMLNFVAAPNNTGATIDVQRPTLNARDPDDGQNYLFPAEPFPGDIPGTNDNDVVTAAKGRISIPEAGVYTFWVQSDDGFLFRIRGADGTPDPGFQRVSQGNNPPAAQGTFQMSNPNEMFYDGGTGNTNTRGIIHLATGTYDIDFFHWEGGGGFGYELTAAPGAWPHGGGTPPAPGFQLVGFSPPVSQLTLPVIADPGWTVISTNPDGMTGFSIADAESAINAVAGIPAHVSQWDYLDFFDPNNGNQGQWPGTNPWPLNTDSDNNQYAMRATGTLVITEPGTYYLGFQGDDGGYMQIDGPIGEENTAQWSAVVENLEPGFAVLVQGDSGSGLNNRLQKEVGTGNSRSIGAIDLVAGTYTIKTLVYEGGGGSWWEVIGAKAPGTSLPTGFAYPLLRRGGETTYMPPAGIQLVAQPGGVGTPPGTFVAVNDFALTGGAPVASISLTFGSEAGRTYKVLASTDLETWIEVAAAVPASGGAETTHVVDVTGIPEINGQPKVFFRVVIN